MKPDWTINEATGRSNSSELFEKLIDAVDLLIQHSAHDLIKGNSHTTAGLIMAHLAHKYGLRPGPVCQCLCDIQGCDTIATQIACGKPDHEVPTTRHPEPGHYCEKHAQEIIDEGNPEYHVNCPSCGFFFGV